jgi:DNA-binding SARP family transcriptional activator
MTLYIVPNRRTFRMDDKGERSNSIFLNERVVSPCRRPGANPFSPNEPGRLSFAISHPSRGRPPLTTMVLWSPITALLYDLRMRGEWNGDGLLVRLLGPVELASDGTPVRMPQQSLRALLAVLALSANHVVSSDSLIDTLWQEPPSREREQNLHVRVYQLRRLLTGAEPGQDASRLVTAAPGYRLELATEQLDVARFRQIVAAGRATARSGHAPEAVEILRVALDLWRGPALADVAGLSPRLEGAAVALDELRLAVREDWADAALSAGYHADLTTQLVALVARHPLRERLRGLLMLALYRCGQQSQALVSYGELRRLLADELGIDPGPELRELRQRILRSDPSLLPAGPPAGSLADPDPAPSRSTPRPSASY